MSSFRLSADNTWSASSSLFLDTFDEFRNQLNEYLDGAEAVKGLDLSIDMRTTLLELLKSAALSVSRVREEGAQPLLAELVSKIDEEIHKASESIETGSEGNGVLLGED